MLLTMLCEVSWAHINTTYFFSYSGYSFLKIESMEVEEGVFGKREGIHGGEMRGARKLMKVW